MSAPTMDRSVRDCAGGEGLPRVSPAVMDRLQAYAEQMQGDVVMADTKASTLLGWSGTALAVLTSVLLATGDDPTPTRSVPGWAGLVGLAGFVCLALCVIVLVLAIRPRLGRGLPGGYSYNTEDRGFIAFAHVGPAFLVQAAKVDTGADEPWSHLVDPRQVVRRVELLARIALVKHRLTRLACTLLVVGVPLLGASAAGVLGVIPGGGA